jgi:phosphoribosylanthranilate isomerase
MANSQNGLWVKICGLTDPAETRPVAQAGADAIGFICVPRSPRYVPPAQLAALTQPLQSFPERLVERVGVFVDATLETLVAYQVGDRLTALQLHGQESPADCQRIRARYPELTLIKAFRIRQATDLAAIAAYDEVVDRILLDAYHPQQWGGTGQTLDWATLQRFQPHHPWILAGGLTPDNVTTALAHLTPYGIDLSSGVEISPGHKDVGQVQRLFEALRSRQPIPSAPPTAD